MTRWWEQLFGRPPPPYAIETWAGDTSGWWWRLRHTNGETLAHSEEYTSRAARDSTVRALSLHTKIPVKEAL